MAIYNRKLTDKVQKTIVESLENGLSIAAACGRACIAKSTFYDWYNKGAEAKSGKYRDFHDAVDNAKNTAQSNFENVIASAANNGTWQAAAWWLERRRPDMYNKPDKIDGKFKGEVKSDATVNLLDKIKEKRKELDDIRSN